MVYRIGDLTVQGEQPTHTNVIRVTFTPKIVDGGKARIRVRRMSFIQEGGCSLSMLKSDDTSPCDMAPESA